MCDAFPSQKQSGEGGGGETAWHLDSCRNPFYNSFSIKNFKDERTGEPRKVAESEVFPLTHRTCAGNAGGGSFFWPFWFCGLQASTVARLLLFTK